MCVIWQFGLQYHFLILFYIGNEKPFFRRRTTRDGHYFAFGHSQAFGAESARSTDAERQRKTAHQ